MDAVARPAEDNSISIVEEMETLTRRLQGPPRLGTEAPERRAGSDRSVSPREPPSPRDSPGAKLRSAVHKVKAQALQEYREYLRGVHDIRNSGLLPDTPDDAEALEESVGAIGSSIEDTAVGDAVVSWASEALSVDPPSPGSLSTAHYGMTRRAGRKPPVAPSSTWASSPGSRLGTGSLLSSIDDALRSLDMAVAAEEAAEAAAAAGAEIAEEAVAAKESAGSGEIDPMLLAVMYSAPPPVSIAPRVKPKPNERVVREAGARWLGTVLGACAKTRKGAALCAWSRSACRIASPYAAGPGGAMSAVLGPRRHADGLKAGLLLLTQAVGRRLQNMKLGALLNWRRLSPLETSDDAAPRSKSPRSPRFQREARLAKTAEAHAVATKHQETQRVLDQLAASEAENRWLRQAVLNERSTYRGLTLISLLLFQHKAAGFRALKRNSAALRPPLPRRPRCAGPQAYDADTSAFAALWLGTLLSRARRRTLDRAWRRLAARGEFCRGRELLSEAHGSQAARASLRDALRALGRPPGGVAPQASQQSRERASLARAMAEEPGLVRRSPLEVFAPGRR